MRVNFSFALISLISARIINWKKSRLQIETDLIRNLYMLDGFFMVIFALIQCGSKTIRNTVMDNGSPPLFSSWVCPEKCRNTDIWHLVP